MPIPKATHIAKSLMPMLNLKLVKECIFPNAERKRKHGHTTLVIRNAGESADMKIITLNKLTTKRKVKCLETPHYA